MMLVMMMDTQRQLRSSSERGQMSVGGIRYVLLSIEAVHVQPSVVVINCAVWINSTVLD